MTSTKPPYETDKPVPIVITGCPRSGTKYTTTILRQLGHWTHESDDGANGFVDWMWLFRERNPHRVGKLFLQVRDPLDCIPSMALKKDVLWDWMCGVTPIDRHAPPLSRAARFWLHWDRMLLSLCDDWYCVEYQKSMIDALQAHTGLLSKHFAAGDGNRNANPKSQRTTYQAISEAISAREYHALLRLSRQFGYR